MLPRRTQISASSSADLKPVPKPGAPKQLCPDPRRFVRDVQPVLESNDVQGLTALLGKRYTQEQICQLLADDNADARKLAALSLAMVGRLDCVRSLAEHLRDPDPMVNEMAEHALWSIWFRGGTPEANDHLLRGSQAINDQDVERAAEHFSAALELCPAFAEAYNQRAIACYLQEQFDDSLADCRRAAELMPQHFGAWAGMGHCYAHLGELEDALHCYRRALEINPHLDCVAEMVGELERHAQEGRGDSGEFGDLDDDLDDPDEFNDLDCTGGPCFGH